MKPIPTAPTDNLYKFVAILGLWMFLGLLALLGWFVYLEYEVKDNSIASSSYFRSVQALSEIEDRMESIRTGNLEENKLDWVHKSLDLEQEKHVLEIAQENHSESVAKNQYAVDSEVGEELRYIKPPVAIVFGIFYIACMSFCFVIGFWKWKKKIQDPEIVFKKKNTELLEKSIEKLNLEIQALKGEQQNEANK